MQAIDQNHLTELFAAHDLRLTRQRAAVYLALSATVTHPTVDDLYRAICDDDQGISLATVYNTLEVLCSTGLAQKLATDGLSCRYDATTHNHLHFRNENTGTVQDVPDHLGTMLLERLPRDVIEQIESQMGLKIHEVKIELVGATA